MILVTGATSVIGGALLRRLTQRGGPVRCLVRDPRRLGPERVRVQIALGDLADPQSFRNALRGVRTVVHLAAAIRDQPAGSIEELTGIATWRMVTAAERAGVQHFVYLSTLGASSHNRARLLRAKALAERAVLESDMPHTVLAPSIVYAPGDRFLTALQRMAMVLPVVPVIGRGRALFQPIWADDVADCIVATLEDHALGRTRLELAGPETLSARAMIELVLRAGGRERPMVALPTPLLSRVLRAGEAVARSRTPITWDEAELLEVAMTARDGTADAESLGVTPRRMAAVLGTS